jgi:hypothetical protein
MRSPSLAPDELEGLPWLSFWSFIEESFKGGPAFKVHGWLNGHPTLDDGFHLSGLMMGFDFADHHWVETTTGLYRLDQAVFGAKPPCVHIWRWPPK